VLNAPGIVERETSLSCVGDPGQIRILIKNAEEIFYNKHDKLHTTNYRTGNTVTIVSISGKIKQTSQIQLSISI